MPLTPHLLLAVGGDNRYVSLDAAAVDRANTLQLLGAVHRVFARPIADVVEFIDVQRRARLGARLQETEETRSDD